MNATASKRLQLRRQTLRSLSEAELGQVAGGTLIYYGGIYAYWSGGTVAASLVTGRPPPPPSGTISCP